jgi:hypothetical protein
MRLPIPDDLIKTITFFGDSSSKDKRYMVLGGFAVGGSKIGQIERDIAAIRSSAGIRSEFHWNSYRGGNRQSSYENLISYGFDLITQGSAHLHIMIADFHQFDHRMAEDQNRDTSVNKLYYQLCLHRLARFYGKRRAVHVRLDAGNDSEEICERRQPLCIDAVRKYDCRPRAFRSVEPVNSVNSGVVQMADVILGGIASNKNNGITDTAKGRLSEYILGVSGRPDWGDTHHSARQLTVWNFKV